MKLYFNGKIIDEKDFRLQPNDRGLLLGDGLFETMRAYRGIIVFILDHWQRLNAGAAVINLALPITFLELEQAITQVLEANHLQKKDAILRLTITRGPGPRGLLPPAKPSPNVMLMAEPIPELKKTIYNVCIANTCRNEYSPLAAIKSLNYLDNILARQEAEKLGMDDALLLNTEYFFAGASAANLFFIRDGMLQTPRLQDGALPGIIRKKIILLAQELNIPAIEMQIGTQDLLTAAEAFLTNSFLGVMPIAKVNEHIIGAGVIGDITQKMQEILKKYIDYEIRQ